MVTLHLSKASTASDIPVQGRHERHCEQGPGHGHGHEHCKHQNRGHDGQHQSTPVTRTGNHHQHTTPHYYTHLHFSFTQHAYNSVLILVYKS